MSYMYEFFSDRRWRLNNLYLIKNKKSQLIKFNENPIQQKINECIDKKRAILKARQFGVTTNAVIEMLDKVLFTKNFTGCILAHENDAIKKIFAIPRLAYDRMPEAIKPRIDKGGGSKYEMYFPENNSKIYCDLESRGDTINELHVSEVAFMQVDRLMATLQAVPINGKVTLETTPNGLDETFYEIWNDDSGYTKLFYPWFFHDEYQIPVPDLELTASEIDFITSVRKQYSINLSKNQIAFRRSKQKELKRLYIQEYPENDISCFLMSGNPVCDQAIIRKLIENVIEPIEETETLKIFSRRNNKKDYVIGADPAQGIGNDFSVATVFCIQDMDEVAFLRGQFTPFNFAKELEILAEKFSNGAKHPLMAVESNNHGHAVLLELIEHIRYPNIYYAKKDRPGWITDMITRPVAVNQFIDALQNGHVKINSKVTLLEMTTLTNKNGKIQASTGRHDDAMMASAIGTQMLLDNVIKMKQYEDIGRAILV